MNLLRPFPIVAFLLLGLLFFNSCNQSEKKAPKITKDSLKRRSIKDWNKTIPGNFNSEQELFFDTLQLESFITAHPLLKEYTASIQKFYSNRHFAFAWYNKNGLIEQAGNLTDRVKNLKDEGINKDIPYRASLDSMIYAKSTKKPNIELELMLTAQYFVFAKLAWEGMDASISKSSEWFLPRKKIAYDAYLDSMIKSPAKFAGTTVAPVYRQYDLLKNFLIKYRELEQNDQWQPIVADKKSYKPGDSSAVIAQIKTRLFKLEDFKGDTTDTHYNDEFLLAVKQFQERSGMPADGTIGPGTLTELNIPIKKG
ncbi:peptidoglycan-binding protein [Pedobacter steynii]